jgi:hypothetical protein
MLIRSDMSGMRVLAGLRAAVETLPKPRCHHLDSATQPDMNVSVHPAPQQRGVWHTSLGEAWEMRL